MDIDTDIDTDIDSDVDSQGYHRPCLGKTPFTEALLLLLLLLAVPGGVYTV